MADVVLELGGILNPENHPKYWKKKQAERGLHSAADLFCVSPRKMKHHSLVFAQSGSGKSFIVGRLIEELCLRTHAKCLIFDPNSDYRKMDQVDEDQWTNADYNDDIGIGFLPTEKAKSAAYAWGQVEKAFFVGQAQKVRSVDNHSLRLNLEDLSPSMFVQDSSENLLLELEFCLRSSESLLSLFRILNHKGVKQLNAKGLVSLIEQHLVLAKKLTATELEQFIANEFVDATVALERQAQDLLGEVRRTKDPDEKEKLSRRRQEVALTASFNRSRVKNVVNELIKLIELVSEDTIRLFTGKLNNLLDKGLLYGGEYEVAPFEQLNVVDLPSYEVEARLLAVGAALSQVWRSAQESWERALESEGEPDTRVPFFVFVDEAHNLIPADAQTADQLAIREQFRRVAAEGRKFGIFLILITQRPDKLDPLVVSECENKMVLKLGSRDVLERQADVLGLTKAEVEQVGVDVVRFKPGRAYCIGPWASTEPGASGVEKFYGAARRTKQGGRNLDDDHWASKDDVFYDPFEDE